MPKHQHGGRRKGAGRKASVSKGERIPRLIHMDNETVSKASRIGEGNMSLGVRKAVKEYPEKETK